MVADPRLAADDRVVAVFDDVVPAAAAVDLVALAVEGFDEVAAAFADQGVLAEVAHDAVVAVVADQHVGTVGSLEALVVAEDFVLVAAARRAAAAAEGDPQIVFGAGVGN